MGKRKKRLRLVFDIGKTNKKCFLFDEHYQQVYKSYVRFPEIEDEDGYPTDDLAAIVRWMKETTRELLRNKDYEITRLNFSTYGATLVHLDHRGEVLTPLYTYTNPGPEETWGEPV